MTICGLLLLVQAVRIAAFILLDVLFRRLGRHGFYPLAAIAMLLVLLPMVLSIVGVSALANWPVSVALQGRWLF